MWLWLANETKEQCQAEKYGDGLAGKADLSVVTIGQATLG